MVAKPKIGNDMQSQIDTFLSTFISNDNKNQQIADYLNGLWDIGNTFMQASHKAIENPDNMVQTTTQMYNSVLQLWTKSLPGFANSNQDHPVSNSNDKRFKDPLWENDPYFNFFKQSYLVFSQWIDSFVNNMDGLDEDSTRRLKFYSRQLTDALAPTNFPWTNPTVVSKTMETGGTNLISGYCRFMQDWQESKSLLNIDNADLTAFTLGENIANTPGKVIYQNELMQLIQYEPTTQKVFKTPLLIIPPWINKFYIFDLPNEKSFIKWAIQQGHTVFVISWVNPNAQHADKSFADYITQGPLAALDAIKAATGEQTVNAVGHCIGGNLLSCMLGYLGKDASKYFNSVTLLTTLFDFSKAGELSIFTSEDNMKFLQEKIDDLGYLDGKTMAATFNLLRANDLIWSAFINNYLLAQEPPQFDFLFWNADSTHLPAKMYQFYVENMFQKNLLMKPGAMSFFGKPVDLSKHKVPTFFLGAKDDHIAPWQAIYPGAQMFKGIKKFVLAGSGHIAGVINPPLKNKYSYWTNDSTNYTDPDQWLQEATEHAGSWWTEWLDWTSQFAGDKVDAKDRTPGNGKLAALEEAPGSYVRVQAK